MKQIPSPWTPHGVPAPDLIAAPVDMVTPEPTTPDRQGATPLPRADWLSLLACAQASTLIDLLAPWAPMARIWLRRPETGLVMVQARAGGSGERFNLGEMSATRCTLRLTDCGSTGVGWVAGRDAQHAEAIALADALLQSTAHAARVQSTVIEPLHEARQTALMAAAQRAAATRVEFFTMTRGT